MMCSAKSLTSAFQHYNYLEGVSSILIQNPEYIPGSHEKYCHVKFVLKTKIGFLCRFTWTTLFLLDILIYYEPVLESHSICNIE